MRGVLQFRVCIIVCLAVILIATAIAFSVVRGVLPYATEYKSEIETELSRQIGLPVHIEKIDADLHWFSPRLKLLQVSVYDADNKNPLFHFKEFLFELDTISSLLRQEMTVGEVSLVGVNISVERHPGNRWVVQGVEIQGDDSKGLNEQLLYSLLHADYSLLESDIHYRDFTDNKLSLALLDVNISVENYLDNHVLELSMLLPSSYGKSISVVVDVDGEPGKPLTGDFYIDGEAIVLSKWQQKFSWLPEYHFQGELDGLLWGEVNEGIISEIQARVSTNKFSIARSNKHDIHWDIDHLSSDLRFERYDSFWHLNVADLNLERAGNRYWQAVSNIILDYDKNGIRLSADYLRLSDLFQLAEVILPSSFRSENQDIDNILTMQMQGDVYNLKLKYLTQTLHSVKRHKKPDDISADSNAGVETKPARKQKKELSFHADVIDLGFKLKEVPFQVSGLDAVIAFKKNEATVNLLSQDVEVYFPELFRNTLQADLLEGVAQLVLSEQFTEDNAWSFDAPALHMQNAHIDTYSRIKLNMPAPVSGVLSGQAVVQKNKSVADTKAVTDKKAADTDTSDTETADTKKKGENIADTGQSKKTASHEQEASNKQDEKTSSKTTEAATEKKLSEISSLKTEQKMFVAAEQHLFVDVQTNFYDAYTRYASEYLPVGIMSKGLVEWLDKAITSGYVEQGSFILYGNVDDFPFRQSNGVMEVLFMPVDVNMKFLDDWPALSNLSATIKFYNEGMFVYGGVGETMNAYISAASVSIEDLEKPHLHLDAKAVSTALGVQQYVWKSPLDNVLGDTLRLFKLNGDTVLDLAMDIDLEKENIRPTFKGDLDFIKTSWTFPALEYSLENINGHFHFTENSIKARNVSAIVDARQVRISADTIRQNSSPEAVFRLSGPIEIDSLLGVYSGIPESWLTGFSQWDISVFVPYDPTDYQVRFEAASSLQGVGIAVSDVLSKKAKQRLPLTLDIDVQKDNALHINMNSQDVFSLSADRNADRVTDFELESSIVRGKGSFTEGLSRDKEISLQLDYLDLYSLLASEKNKKDVQALKPTIFPPLNWHVKELKWDDWNFTDVLLKTDVHKNGLLIKDLVLNGPSMHFKAKGTWLTSWRYKNETLLSGSVESDNMGAMLAGLGFEKSIDRSKFSTSFNASWRGEPYALSWHNMKGSSSFHMEDGEVLKVDPGAGGRLLGLMNIFKLTNRLSLDFDDVYRKGFHFDKIDGEFDFVYGKGDLKKFDVTGPAADINLFGNVGLLDRDYDLLMRVKPHSDGLTFAGGALLGGVVVGASLAIIQKVLNISLISHDLYRITGSWDDPLIELIVEDTDDTEDDDEDY